MILLIWMWLVSFVLSFFGTLYVVIAFRHSRKGALHIGAIMLLLSLFGCCLAAGGVQ